MTAGSGRPSASAPMNAALRSRSPLATYSGYAAPTISPAATPGCRAPNSRVTCPPSLYPPTMGRSRASTSMSAATSSASWVYDSSPLGLSERPCARLSGVIARIPSPRSGITGAHRALDVNPPWTSTTGMPAPRSP
jgi:hypothetical protein